MDGVSKLTQIEFASKAEAQAENFQKMAMAMANYPAPLHGGKSVAFDAAGNQVKNTWDHRNRLTKVEFRNSSSANTKVVQYQYDAFNRLVRYFSVLTSGTLVSFRVEGEECRLDLHPMGGREPMPPVICMARLAASQAASVTNFFVSDTMRRIESTSESAARAAW